MGERVFLFVNGEMWDEYESIELAILANDPFQTA